MYILQSMTQHLIPVFLQMPIIEKIRVLIKSQENGQLSNKSSDDELNSVKVDDERPVSEEEILESLGLKEVPRTTDGKIDHAKLSMKDRMAIVRGMRKRRKRGPGPQPNGQNANSGKKSTDKENCNDKDSDSNNEASNSSTSDTTLDLASEGHYNGYVCENETFEAKPPVFDDKDYILIEVG